MTSAELAVVVIGRNEGARLTRCLDSLSRSQAQMVYVDSGSTDGSAARVRERGVEVVELDMSIPFSAARARNAGYDRLRTAGFAGRFVQFVDGDCEVAAAWLAFAMQQLSSHEDWAIVCGRRRERAPQASVYNRLCDVEWDTPIGEASACGGDFLIRSSVFAQVGGFNPTVIAGEEPELCHRVRALGYRVLRLDHEMTLHDAAMTRFSQWWRRAARAGYAYALVSALHFRTERRIWVKPVVSITVWASFPLFLGLFSIVSGPWPLLGLILYPLLVLKIGRSLVRERHLPPPLARIYALACVVGKFAEFQGVLGAARDLLLGRQRVVIEYKTASPGSE